MCAPLHQPPPGLPHARGGVSVGALPGTSSEASSPRTWGCFRHGTRHAFFFAGLPHARGVVSFIFRHCAPAAMSSPRTWGCFYCRLYRSNEPRVFPTHVGVFLGSAPRGLLLFCLPHARGGVSACRPSRPRHAGLPHARGGVSSSTSEVHGKGLSSPRTWGCFTLGAGLSGFGIVFPTHVGGGRQAGVAPESPFPTVGAFHVCP